MKKFEIKDNDLSDGYHTFDELYEHRNLLWINFCLTKPDDCYWVADHFDGWDLLLMRIDEGQMSYHVESKYRALYEDSISECPANNHIFDGHSSEDVLDRLKIIASFGA